MVAQTRFLRLVLAAAAWTLLGNAAALSIAQRGLPGSKCVALNFDVERSLAKLLEGLTQGGDDSSSVTLKNGKVAYFTSLVIGSNKQKVSVEIDTGSSDLWVVGANATCESQTSCKSGGTYKSALSYSSKDLGTPFKIGYVDGTSTTGEYVKDDVFFASDQSISVTGLQFAVANATSNSNGILGIGLTSLESADSKYPNLPALLKEQGVIDTNAYSLYLNTVNSSQGSIIFGGYDSAKINGSLTPLPLTGDSTRLGINLGSVSFGNHNLSVDKPFVLDTGATLTYFPTSIFKQIGEAFGGQYNGEGYIVNCTTSSIDNMTFNFDEGAKITIPYKDLLTELDSGGCMLGILPNDQYATLGDNFLRSAYVVYNLDNRTISLSQVKYSDQSNIVSI
ncbi:Piso0_001288 [Millerozyma farinosa CBS 7064]|uniref:candidapepsin n=1 Tax=Pichia sorbitophila (strain ATCC MYA-4447 / BCRC 22081 / CBS 7064 / NBRC 10061 / NRRL Y-12695) TaxID=559304 RepID=G8YMR9_PICSO|nr:Piso0_001288 [Millerozyma farinosa CBS 7064]